MAKWIACFHDIYARYAPLYEELNRDMPSGPIYSPADIARFNDPVRLRKRAELDAMRMAEQNQRLVDLAEQNLKPVVVPNRLNKEGHLIAPRVLTPNTFRFFLGVDPSCLGTCANPKCQKQFLKTKLRRKYCCRECLKRANNDRYIEKRRQKGKQADEGAVSISETRAAPPPPEDPEYPGQ